MIIAHHENENKFHRAWPQSKHCEIQYLQTQPRPDSGQTLLHDPLVSLSQAVYHFIFCLKKEEIFPNKMQKLRHTPQAKES